MAAGPPSRWQGRHARPSCACKALATGGGAVAAEPVAPIGDASSDPAAPGVGAGGAAAPGVADGGAPAATGAAARDPPPGRRVAAAGGADPAGAAAVDAGVSGLKTAPVAIHCC